MKLYSDEELAQLLDQEIFHQISEAADRLGVECYVVGEGKTAVFVMALGAAATPFAEEVACSVEIRK